LFGIAEHLQRGGAGAVLIGRRHLIKGLTLEMGK
jgi:hypothetical protein